MKKTIIFLMFILIILNNAYANNILYINKKVEKISTGTNLIYYEILTSDGWINAQALELDLDDNYNKLALLTSEEGSKKLAAVSAMTTFKNAVAGINADFFAGRSGIGNSMGLAIENGKIYSSAAEENKEQDIFTSFIIDDEDNIIYDYIKDDITIYCGKNEEEIKARYVNKYTDNTDYPTIFTREWGEYSFGSTEILPVTEIVVEDGKVVEIRENEGAVEIPEDGFVIMATGESAEFLKENLKKKAPVYYEVKYSPNIENIEFAITGGTKLIENGIIPESFSHDVKGRNPRTVLGTNKEKDKVYLITIDGRSSKSLGMTLEEVSEFLKAIDINTAINLDGGGSTTMAARKLGEENVSIINTPSGGQERLVANGVGIVSTAPESEKIYELKINLFDKNIFVNERRKVSVVGYNKYYNPVEIDPDDVKWDYEGVELEFESGEIYATEAGKSTLIAKVGKAKGECEINILSNPNEIYVYPKEITINPGEKVNYTIHSKDKNGQYAATLLSSYDVKVEAYYKDNKKEEIPEDAYVDGLSFTAKSGGTYILAITKNDITTFAKVNVTSDSFRLIDSFENETFTFDEYPDEVGGNASLSKEQVYDGETSVKLEYDFDRDIQIRGAYIVLNEEAIIPEDATHIAFYVYNDGYKDEMIKVKWKDANDQIKLAVIQDNISHEGWQEIKYDVTSFAKPLRISDIYLAQDDISSRNKGQIYVDRFGYYVKSTSVDNNINIPVDVKESISGDEISGDDTFSISFINILDKSNYMLNVVKNKRLIHNINEKTDLTVVINEKNEDFDNTFVKEKSGDINVEDKYPVMKVGRINHQVIYHEQYDVYSNKWCTIITLNVKQNGIRKSDEEQYMHFESDIIDDETGNVIIVLNGNLDDFSDERERNVFIDTLCKIIDEEKKNITIVQTGYNQDVSMERGIPVLNIKDTKTAFEEIHDSKFLRISIVDEKNCYEYINSL